MRISTKQILMIFHFKILKEEMKITLTIFKYAGVSDENKTDEKEWLPFLGFCRRRYFLDYKKERICYNR